MAHQWLKWPRRSAGQWSPQPRLVGELHAQFAESARLEAAIRANLKSMSFPA